MTNTIYSGPSYAPTQQVQQGSRFGVGIAIGAGCGILGTGLTAFLISSSRRKKLMLEHEQTVSRVRRRAYQDGLRNNEESYKSGYESGYAQGTEDTLAESQKWISENIMIVDGDNPDEIAANLKSKIENPELNTVSYESTDILSPHIPSPTEKDIDTEKTTREPVKNVDSKPLNEEKRQKSSNEEEKTALNEAETEEKRPQRFFSDGNSTAVVTKVPKLPIEDNFKRVGDNIMIRGCNLHYPRGLFYNDDGNFVGESVLRQNLREYEKDVQKLRRIWILMKWGDYAPTFEEEVESETRKAAFSDESEDLEAISEGQKAEDSLAWDEDMSIPEPFEKTLEQQQYLDHIDRYIPHPEDAPRIISEQEFTDDKYADHGYFEYYAKDNVFIDSEDPEKPIDPFELFGFVEGKDLFRAKEQLDDEHIDDENWEIIENTVYVKNPKHNLAAEITRYNESYSSLKDGSIYTHGQTEEDYEPEGF